MTAQMLVQLPLLAAAGMMLRGLLPARLLHWSSEWDRHGITGLLLASLTAALWSVPKLLDSAVADPILDAAKYLSVPLLIGLPLAISWPRAGFVVRGVFLLELVATLFRMGWLYLGWPDRLCNSYLIDDQQRLGLCLLWTGVGVCLVIAAQLLWGRMDRR